MKIQFTMRFKRAQNVVPPRPYCLRNTGLQYTWQRAKAINFGTLSILSQIRNFSIVIDHCCVFLADLLCFLYLSCILSSHIVVCFACVDYRSIAHSGAHTPFLFRHSRARLPSERYRSEARRCEWPTLAAEAAQYFVILHSTGC